MCNYPYALYELLGFAVGKIWGFHGANRHCDTASLDSQFVTISWRAGVTALLFPTSFRLDEGLHPPGIYDHVHKFVYKSKNYRSGTPTWKFAANTPGCHAQTTGWSAHFLSAHWQHCEVTILIFQTSVS